MLINTITSKVKSNKYISEYFSYKAFKQLIRYLIVGFSTVGLEFINLRLFTEYFNFWYLTSNTLAYIISFMFNFLLNKFWSFKSAGNFKKQILIYGALFIINLALSNCIMYILTDVFSVMYMISKFFAVGVIVSWNFIIYKKVIFKDAGNN